ncbi:MAG: iron ABC transporter permease [Oscillospiraceae bacterium]|nr:iron ABC transporter permease [Oscillospiraceae bacterium]
MTKTVKNSLIYIISIFVLIISIFAACIIGSSDISFETVVNVLKHKVLIEETLELKDSMVYIVWDLRLPRALLAVAVGGGLAVAGTSMQSITRNVMADPYVLGISSGALALVSVGYFFGGALTATNWFISTLAFIGSLVSLFIVFAIGGFSKAASPGRLILSGMAVSISLNAIAQFFIYIGSDSNKASSIISWMMGSLAATRWNNLWITFIGCIAGTVFFICNARAFDLIALGDETAISLGTNTALVKRTSLIVISIITGLSVSSCGMIGLVGFVVPHVVRFIIGTEHRKLFPLVFITGGIFLLWMDIFARTILSPQEVPIGVFTALVGGPFFIWMIRRNMKGKH